MEIETDPLPLFSGAIIGGKSGAKLFASVSVAHEGFHSVHAIIASTAPRVFQPMQPFFQFVGHLLHAVPKVLQRPDLALALATAISAMMRPWWNKWRRRAMTPVIRTWPAIPATIDVVSVADRMESDKKPYSAAVLTYFYRNPELQMGEYERAFPLQTAARQWADQFKGRTVTVHVNPANAGDSELLESDLEGVTTHSAVSIEEAARREASPVLSQGYRLLSGMAELVCLAGAVMSASLLWGSIASGGSVRPMGWIWLGLVLLVFVAIAGALVGHQIGKQAGAKGFQRSFTLWSPTWMRWIVRGSALALGFLWTLIAMAPAMPEIVQQWMILLKPHAVYICACWLFLALGAYHAAVMRSQEEPRALGGAALGGSAGG